MEKMTTYNNVQMLDTIYKRDSHGKVRVWSVEIGDNGHQDAAYRVHSGIKDGEIVVSQWKKTSAKNVGRSNETTSFVQAHLQAASEMKKKLDKDYFRQECQIDDDAPFKPMLAKEYKGVEFENNWVFVQPKLDGIRCIAKKDGLFTRTGKPIESVPHIWEQVKSLFERDPNLVLDGELYNHTLKDNFNKITSLVRKQKLSDDDLAQTRAYIQYHVYDVVKADKKWFTERTEFLHQIVEQWITHPAVKYVDTISVDNQEELDAEYANFIAAGFEGMMIRNNEPYENKRSANLLKRKDFLTDEFKIVSIEEGEGNWEGYAKRFLCELPNGEQFGAGVRGNQAVLKELWESEVPNWATVRYFTPTPDGIPRFPVVVDWGYGERVD